MKLYRLTIRELANYSAWFCWICNPAGLSISICNALISDCKSLYSNAVGLQIRPNQLGYQNFIFVELTLFIVATVWFCSRL